MQDPYIVKKGDTLSAIAKTSGTNVAKLKTLNKIANANQLEVGQALYLSPETAFSFSVLFLDALRHPIENLKYKLKFDDKTTAGKTGSNGVAPKQVTTSAKSQIEVLVQDLQGQWVNVCKVASDFGHKLVTLVSDTVVVKGETEKHPKNAPAMPVAAAQAAPARKSSTNQPPPPKPATGAPSKNNPAVKTKKVKGPQGQSVIEISVDIPQGLLDFFAEYKGEEIGAKDWKVRADDLKCDKEVLQAIAQVESGGRNAFWRLNKSDGANIPAIMFERHYFSRLTKNKHDQTHPDISWPTGYRKAALLGAADNKMHDGKVESGDIYSSYAASYLRLINAYRLDADAALKSCSWGKFQVMGANFSLCDSESLESFVNSMCASELAQITLLAGFIQKKPQAWKNPKIKALGKEITLLEAVRTKDWKAIAFNYNGPGYTTYAYDTKLKAAYEKFKAEN